MKKPLLTMLGVLGALMAQPAAAQYYIVPNLAANQNPGGLNTDLEYAYGSVTGWNLLITGDANTQATPVWSGVQTLPFSFQMNGQSFTSYKVSSSGVLTFSTAATAVPPTLNEVLPSAQVPDNSICYWGTLLTANSDYVLSKTFGTAPHRQYWVQFNSVMSPFPTGTSTAPIASSLLYGSIVLEEGTNKVYLVWQRSAASPQSLTAGIQLNGTTAVQLPTSPTVSIPNLADPTAIDNQYYEFGLGTQPALDVAASALSLPNTAVRQSTVPIVGQFRNQGTSTITSVTVNYRVANGPVVTAQLSGLNMGMLTNRTFTHPTPWQPTTGGVTPVKVWFSLPNGSPDQNPSNDTVRTTVVVADSTMQRTVIEEDFTSSTCGPCRLGNINTRSVNQTPALRGKFIEVKYQQNFPSPFDDPYYSAESGSRFNYYTGSYIPYMLLDGHNDWNSSLLDSTPNSNNYNAADFQRFYNRPAMARVGGGYTVRNNTVTATATIKPLFAIPAGRLVAHMAITERQTTMNFRTNGETRFFDVMKKMLPNQNGTILPALASGQVFNLNLSHTFPTPTLPLTWQYVEHFDSLQVVVFVQDVVTKEVYQGGYLKLSTVLATRNQQSGPAFSLYPNPATGSTTLLVSLARPETVRVEVLDMLGRNVLNLAPQALTAGAQEVVLKLTHQAAGLYTVRLTTSQGVRTSKLTLE